MPTPNDKSEELQDVMGRIPGWVIRWGISLIMVILAIILLLSYLIKYPDVVMAPIVITTANPPADLIAKSTGKIETLIPSDGQQVTKNSVIAVLFNTGDHRQILSLREQLSTYGEKWQEYITSEFTAQQINAGELQNYLSQFNTSLENYKQYIEVDLIGERKANITEQITIQQTQLNNSMQQINLMLQEYEIQKKDLARDSLLYSKKAISVSEYESSKQAMLQKDMSLVSFRSSIEQAKAGISNNKGQIIELEIQQRTDINDLTLQLRQNREQLLSQIDLWRDRYVLTAPIDGRITFTKYWNENQNITAGERLASIVPSTASEIIGKLTVPSASFGKISIGQTVNVKLNGFPYMEFGMLKGKLISISAIPDAEGYSAEIQFPQGMTSTYDKPFDLIQQMDGTADIVTRDLRLIERFIMPVRNLIRNN